VVKGPVLGAGDSGAEVEAVAGADADTVADVEPAGVTETLVAAELTLGAGSAASLVHPATAHEAATTSAASRGFTE
jgi:hypothetical protein